MTNNLFSKIINLIKLGVVTLVSTDKNSILKAQISYLGRAASMAIGLPYGLYANPPKDTLGLIFNIYGQESNRVFIPLFYKKRIKELKEGEVTISNPIAGSTIKFLENGDIEITAKGKLIINVEGDVELKANNVNIDSQKVNLGQGGKQIARLGDEVTVGGSTGTITSAGTNTSI